MRSIPLLSFLLTLAPLSLACTDKDGDTAATDGGDGGDGSTGEAPFPDCDAGSRLCILVGDYTDSEYQMTADWDYLLDGGVFFGDDSAQTVLTIDPGVTVYGSGANEGLLVIRRGSRIEGAAGSADAPIVFTTDQLEGARTRGGWGGLILNGRAPINNCSDGVAENLPCEAEGEGGSGLYGGDDPTDGSGTLRYVRVEFGGTEINSEDEVNGIAFQGVGSGTTVENIQVHMNLDDGIEFFGGTVNVSNLLITGAGDDSLDWVNGWTGTAENVVLQLYSDDGDHGIEADNYEDQMAALPRSGPTLRQVTMIGRGDSDGVGALFRRGTALDAANILITGFGGGCLDIDDAATWALANSSLRMVDSVVACDNNFVEDSEDSPSSVGLWFGNGSGNISSSPAAQPMTGWVPDAGSDADFGAGAYAGAFPPGGTALWTDGWTTDAVN